jgi:hypothetical protein
MFRRFGTIETTAPARNSRMAQLLRALYQVLDGGFGGRSSASEASWR